MNGEVGEAKEVVVAIIDGSPRKESSTRDLANNVAKEISRLGAEVHLFRQDFQRLPLFDDEVDSAQQPSVQALFDCVAAADCIVLSSPEYHNSMSGALKNALDWLSLLPKERKKPMMLCGLIGGGGTMGNSGALVQMMMAVRSMKWWLMPDVMVSVPNIWDSVKDAGIVDAGIVSRVEEFSSRIVEYGAAFREMRGRS